ncbi:hypothetical protein IMZ48_46785 [Candidatus Bathyarchaeota archaeon]|nr:hypothetical protein [Candidatus Bathyarchaeota archaeon]
MKRTQNGSAAHAKSVAATEPENAEPAPANTEPTPADVEPGPEPRRRPPGPVFPPALEHSKRVCEPQPGEDSVEFRTFVTDLKALQFLPDLPPEFIESTMSLLRTLEQEDKFSAAQNVIDRLCYHPAIELQHFEGISAEFFLRCTLSAREHAEMRRPPLRFKMAVPMFWTRRMGLPSVEEHTPLLELMEEAFAADDAEHAAHSFLATSHLLVGRRMTSQRLVTPIAYKFRKRGKMAALSRWLEVAEKADVSIRITPRGNSLMMMWELENEPEEARNERGEILLQLRNELRRPMFVEASKLGAEQRGLFDRMDEEAENRRWEGVLGCYSKGLDAGVQSSSACLRLAVLAAVGLEGIHSPMALRLIREAHSALVDIRMVAQSLLLPRIDAIRAHQIPYRLTATRGDACKTIRGILHSMRPYYKRPSVLVYKRAIRCCLNTAENREAKELVLQMAWEHWDNDVLYAPDSFGALVKIAARTRDFELLQALLEALPWKEYRGHRICKLAMKEVWCTLRIHIENATTTEEVGECKAVLASVNVSIQGIKQAAQMRRRRTKAQIKYTAHRSLHGKTSGRR